MDAATKLLGWIITSLGLYLGSDEIYNLGHYMIDHAAALVAH